MRIDPVGYAEINQNTERAPRTVIKIDFAGTPSSAIYVTSHDDCQIPSGVSPSDVYYNVVKDLSGTSQRINPIKALSTIGAMKFGVIDYNNTITERINTELDDGDGVITAADKGLRGKTVEFYIGEEGLEWDDYILIQTQIVQKVSINEGVYTFNCSDIQRTIRETIFDVRRTTLLSVMDSTQTAVPAINTSDFETLVHGPSYSDLPNDTVGYIQIEDEIIAWHSKLSTAVTHTESDVSFSGNVISSSLIDFTTFDNRQQITVSGSGSNDGVYYVHPTTAPTSNTLTLVETLVTESAGATITVFADIQFYDCVRGSLNTKAVAHTMPEPLPTTDRRTKIEELVYLELPIPKLIYALLTGSLYGSADVLPSNWHLNISTNFVATTEFISIGADYWDTTDDTAGFPTRFLAPKKGTGKKFIEEELLLLAGMFMPVLADGQLGLRRMTNVLSNASASKILDENNVLSIGALTHDMEAVHNQFNIEWNYDRNEKRFTRTATYIDGDSITRHGAATPMDMKFQGLHGTSSTDAMLITHADSARDRYAGPPELITVNCMFSCNVLEVGDIVKLRLNNLQDFVTGGSIDRSFEIQEVRTDWRDGTVQLKLFGSSQAAESVAAATEATVLDSAFYTSAGTDISTVTTGSGTTKWTITSNSTITGDADMNASTAIFYYDGDLEIASGVTLTIQDNVQLRISGDITVNGTIDGTAAGVLAPIVRTSVTFANPHTPGIAGGMGTTQPPGMIGIDGVPDFDINYINSWESPITKGTWNSVPRMGLINNGSTLLGLPTDLRGSSGGNGGTAFKAAGIWQPYGQFGGRGGNGGAGLVVITHNLFSGGSGSITLHGGDGEITTAVQTRSGDYAHASNGAGGAPGGLLILLDGVGSADTTTVYQYFGITLVQYTLPERTGYVAPNAKYHYSSYFTGIGRVNSTDFTNVSSDFTRVQYLDPQETAVIDTPNETTVASAITLQEVSAVNTTLNQTAIEVSVTAPVGSGPDVDNYKASHIYARKTTGDSWFDIGEVGPVGELAFSVVADGTTWEVKAHAVSLAGVESTDYISDTITVTATLDTVIGTGNRIITAPDVEVSGGVEMDETGITAYDGTGTAKVTIDGTTGVITATDAILSGTISATAGVIGGWTIEPNQIESGTAGTHMELNASTGIWMGADAFASAPFSVSVGGALTVENATIGGWTVDANSIESPNNRVILDSTNNRIQVQDAIGTNYTRMDADGITGVDSVLGTVFRLPTDGTAPSFSSGIINSTVFNITSAGILETSSTVGNGGADGQGVRINDAGIKGYKINDANPVFTLDATDGSLTCTDATITGTVTIQAGSSGVANLSDAGDLATGDRVDLLYTDGADQTSLNTAADITGQGDLATQNTADWQTDVTGTAKPTDYADVTTPMQIAAKINYTSFTGANAGETFIHGYDAAGALADVNGSIIYNNSVVSMPRDYTNPNMVCEGYIVYRPTNWSDGRKYAVGVPNAANSYSWTMYLTTGQSVTLAATDIVIGVARHSGSETVESAAVWGYGASPNTMATFNADGTNEVLQDGTTITSGGITLNAGGNIKGGQTAYATGTGFFLGYESAAYKFSVGNTTDYLKWSPTDGLQVNVGDTTAGIEINAGGVNDIRFYGDMHTTPASTGANASIGVRNIDGDNVCVFGGAQPTDTTSELFGVYGQTGVGQGVTGVVRGSSSVGYGVVGVANSTSTGQPMNATHWNTTSTTNCFSALHKGLGVGIAASTDNTSNDSFTIYAEQAGTGDAIYAKTTKTTGTNYGVFSTNASISGRAVFGRTTNTGTGQQLGLYAQVAGITAIGVYSNAQATSGVGFGNYSTCSSSSGWDYYAAGAASNYGPFTGSHDGILKNNDTFEIGDILVDKEKLFQRNISNTIFINEVSTIANQKGAVGVIATPATDLEDDPEAEASQRPAALKDMPSASYIALQQTHKRISFNAVGEGQINVCGENGDLEIGDLIVTSNTAGKGMKQADDIVRGYTVAKVREDVTFSSASEVKMVACIYLCG